MDSSKLLGLWLKRKGFSIGEVRIANAVGFYWVGNALLWAIGSTIKMTIRGRPSKHYYLSDPGSLEEIEGDLRKYLNEPTDEARSS